MADPLGLCIQSGDPARVAYALDLAAAGAALGRPVAILFAGESLALLRPGREPERLAVLRELGVRLMLCDAALKASGLLAADLAPGLEVAGLVSLLVAAPVPVFV